MLWQRKITRIITLGNPEIAKKKMYQINEAYRTLSDEKLRSEYMKKLVAEQSRGFKNIFNGTRSERENRNGYTSSRQTDFSIQYRRSHRGLEEWFRDNLSFDNPDWYLSSYYFESEDGGWIEINAQQNGTFEVIVNGNAGPAFDCYDYVVQDDGSIGYIDGKNCIKYFPDGYYSITWEYSSVKKSPVFFDI